MKTKVYVQVPVTGRLRARAEAECAARCAVLEAAGMEAVSPFSLGLDAGTPDAVAMGRCVEALLGCDGILLHPSAVDLTGRYSRGCRAEACVAASYGLRAWRLAVLPDGKGWRLSPADFHEVAAAAWFEAYRRDEGKRGRRKP